MSNLDNCNEGKNFVEFRRKVQAAEVLSAAIEGKEKRNTHEGAEKRAFRDLDRKRVFFAWRLPPWVADPRS